MQYKDKLKLFEGCTYVIQNVEGYTLPIVTSSLDEAISEYLTMIDKLEKQINNDLAEDGKKYIRKHHYVQVTIYNPNASNRFTSSGISIRDIKDKACADAAVREVWFRSDFSKVCFESFWLYVNDDDNHGEYLFDYDLLYGNIDKFSNTHLYTTTIDSEESSINVVLTNIFDKKILDTTASIYTDVYITLQAYSLSLNKAYEGFMYNILPVDSLNEFKCPDINKKDFEDKLDMF